MTTTSKLRMRTTRFQRTASPEPAYPNMASFFADRSLVDRYLDGEEPVDVFIPVMHTNELWRNNLLSIYREIPVNRLILGDAGCQDDTLLIAREFPRVEVHDHRAFKSLGYSIRKMIEAVSTEWFVYLHSDVCLPENWYEAMSKRRGDFDFFECRQNIVVCLEDPLPLSGTRAYSGSQMGRKEAFAEVLPLIEDDYLYRSEDIVIAELLQKHGRRYGKVGETHHYHQHLPRRTTQSHLERKIQVSYRVTPTRAERVRAADMQARALVKYLEPRPEIVAQVVDNVRELIEIGETTWEQFLLWASDASPGWHAALASVTGAAYTPTSPLKAALAQWMQANKTFAKSLVRTLLRK